MSCIIKRLQIVNNLLTDWKQTCFQSRGDTMSKLLTAVEAMQIKLFSMSERQLNSTGHAVF